MTHTSSTPINSADNTFALQWNIAGLKTKLPELQLLLNQYSPSIFALQETKTPIKNAPNIKDYDIYLVEGSNNANQHGAAIGVRKGTPHDRLQILTKMQAVAVQIDTGTKSTVVSIYLPPSEHSYKKIEAELRELYRQLPEPVILLGDFNAANTEWGSKRNNPRGEMIEKFCEDNGLICLNDGTHTRINFADGTTTAIDLSVISWQISNRFSWKVEEDNHGSDHFPVRLITDRSYPTICVRPRWKYDDADWEKFQRGISDKLVLTKNYTVTEFTQMVFNSAKQSIPRTSGRPGLKSVPWWNETVKKAIKYRRKTLRALRRLDEKNPMKKQALKDFQKARRDAKTAIEDAKKLSWEKFIGEINPTTTSKKLWNTINALSGKRRSNKKYLQIDGTFTDVPADMASSLANHFAAVSATEGYTKAFQVRKAQEEECVHLFNGTPSYLDVNFGFSELCWALNKAAGLSEGPDRIGYPLLKHLPVQAKLILLDIYNDVWNSGIIPTQWKEAIIIPIKKPDKKGTKADEYRPISLTSCVGKILERMINRRLTQEIESNKRLGNTQYAFRPGTGVDSHLAHLETVLENALESGMHADVILLDLSKAFDRTWRHPIITTLSEWNIGSRMQRYIYNFLDERSFRVFIDGALSDRRLLENGIPQGSVISPTLFNIAINSICKSVQEGVEIMLYADDLTIITLGYFPRYVRAKAQKALNSVLTWTEQHGLQFSAAKSKLLHICNGGKHKKRRDLKTPEGPIQEVKTARILGVQVDSKLNFMKHADNLIKDCQSRLRMIKAISCRYAGGSRQTLFKVCNSILISKISHGFGLYSRGGEKLIKRVQPIYHTAIRTISRALRTSPIVSLLAESGQLPFRHVMSAQLVSKACSWLEKQPIEDEHICPMVKRASEWLDQLTGHKLPTLSALIRVNDRAWNSAEPSIDWYIKNKLRAHEAPSKAQAVFNEAQTNRYSSSTIFFTDGSLDKDGVGLGVHSEGIDISMRIPDCCSIFSAEALALLIASENAPVSSHTVIFSDSASCIQAIEHGKSRHPWIQAVEAATATKKITFCWVPSHSGITGNERADLLAGEGRTKECTDTPLPAKDFGKYTKLLLRQAWETEWKNCNTFTRCLKSTTMPWKDVTNTSEQTAITRLRIGHTKMTHNYIMNREDKPQCCGEELTVRHLLLDCRRNKQSRDQFFKNLTLGEILGQENEKNLIEFLNKEELTKCI